MRVVMIHIFIFLSIYSYGQKNKGYYDRVKLGEGLSLLSERYKGQSDSHVSEANLLDFIRKEIYINEPIYDSIAKLAVLSNYYELSWRYVEESQVQLKLLSHYSEYLSEIDLEHHYRKLGEAFYNTGNYNLSIEFFNESLMYIGEAKKDWALSRIGLAYMNLDHIDSSLVYYRRALEISDDMGLKLSHTNSLGFLYFLSGQYKLSELYYMEALNLY